LDRKIETTVYRGTRVVAIEGELDMSNAPELQAALRSAPREPLIVDLTRCAFLDSHGLRALLVGARDRPGRMPLVCSPGNPVRRLLEIAATNRLYRVVATLDEAVD
jgi:anti-anti-sigma factor